MLKAFAGGPRHPHNPVRQIPRITHPIKWQEQPDKSNEFTEKLDLLRGRQPTPMQSPAILKADMFMKKHPRFDTPEIMYQVADVIERRGRGDSLKSPKVLQRSLSTNQAKYRFETGERKKALDLQNWLEVQMSSIESVDRTLPQLIDMKQQVVQIMFNEAISWVELICTDWAQCFRTALNALCLLISKTFTIINSKHTTAYKQYLNQNINIHHSYMATIDNLKEQVRELKYQKQLNEDFNSNLIYNMRVRNKQLKHIERSWKMTSNKYKQLKSQMERFGLEVVDKSDVKLVAPDDFRIVTAIPPKARTNKTLALNGKKTGRPPKNSQNNENKKSYAQLSMAPQEKQVKEPIKKHRKANNTVYFQDTASQYEKKTCKQTLINNDNTTQLQEKLNNKCTKSNVENLAPEQQRHTRKTSENVKPVKKLRIITQSMKSCAVSSTSIKPTEAPRFLPPQLPIRSIDSVPLTSNEELTLIKRQYLQTKKLTGRSHFFMDVMSLDGNKDNFSGRQQLNSSSESFEQQIVVQNDNFKWFVGKDVQTDLSVPFHVTSHEHPSTILKYGLKHIKTSSIQLGYQTIRISQTSSTQTTPNRLFSYQGVLSMKVMPCSCTSSSQFDSRKSVSLKRGIRHSILKTIQELNKPEGKLKSRGNYSVSSDSSDLEEIMETADWKSKLSKLKKERAPRVTEIYRKKTRQSMGSEAENSLHLIKSNKNVDIRKRNQFGTSNSLYWKERTMSRYSKFDDQDDDSSNRRSQLRRNKNSSESKKMMLLEEISDDRRDPNAEKTSSTVQFQEKLQLPRRLGYANNSQARPAGRSYPELPSYNFNSSLRNSLSPANQAKSSKSIFTKSSKPSKHQAQTGDIIQATVFKCLRTDRSNNKQQLLPSEVLVKAKQAATFFTKCLDLKDGSPLPPSRNKNNHTDYLVKQVRAMYLHGYKELTRGEKQLLLTNIIVNYFGIMYGNLKNVSAKDKITKFFKKVAEHQHKDTTLEIFCTLSEVGGNVDDTRSVICVNDLPMYLSMLFTLNVSSIDNPITTLSKVDTHLLKILKEYIGEEMAEEIYSNIHQLIKSKIACRSKTESHTKENDVHIDLEMMCLLILKKILKERLSFKVDFENIFQVLESMEKSFTVSVEFFEFLNRCISDSKIGYISRMKKFLKQCEVLCKNRKCMSREKFSMFALKNGFPKFSQISKQLQKNLQRRKTLRHIRDIINHQNPVEQWKKQKSYLWQELVHSDKLISTQGLLIEFMTNMIPHANDEQAQFLQILYEMMYYEVFDAQAQRLLLFTLSHELTELYIGSLVLLKEKV